MKRTVSAKDWLPLARRGAQAAERPTGEAFRPEWLDFERGIRVGNIEPHERITQILKYHLEETYRTPFVTDRWGRGVFWQWICWLPRANREAKPLSHDVNFGCAKLFITVESDPPGFKSGLQIERGYAEGPGPYPGCQLQKDWDWNRLMRGCRAGSPLHRELRRLILREGFVAEVGDGESNAVFNSATFTSSAAIAAAARRYPRKEWVAFQLYYPMPAAEVIGCTGYELVNAMCGTFAEVVPAMNACMQIALQTRAAPFGRRAAGGPSKK